MCKRLLSLILIMAILVLSVSCEKRPKQTVTERSEYILYTDVQYGDALRHYLDICIPKSAVKSEGIIFYIHGGGWISGDKEVYRDRMISDAKNGYISASINYRYADGKKVLCDDILDDITASMIKTCEIAYEHGLNIKKAMFAGGSAGGHLALMYAYTRVNDTSVLPVAVASYSGPAVLYDENFYNTQYVDDIKKMISCISGTNLTKMTVEEEREKLSDASPLIYVTESTVPTLICHGMLDDVVPYSNAETLYNALIACGVRTDFVVYDHSGHGLEADPDMATLAEELFYAYVEEYL